MTISLPFEDIVVMASDLTAGIILVVLIITITSKRLEQASLSHLLSAAICVLLGIIQRLSAQVISNLISENAIAFGDAVLLPRTPDVIWSTAFLFISMGISAAVAHIEGLYSEPSKDRKKRRMIVASITVASFAALFMLTKNDLALQMGAMVQLTAPAVYLYKNCGRNASSEFLRANSAAIIALLVAIVNGGIRFTGLGYSIIAVVLYSQYVEHVEQVLTGTEEDLELSELKLMANQISSHYIYNSLQCIKGLAQTDPEKAGKAIDKFSGYLRGNLESLTKESLIPFRRELEHTKAYLELEELSGSRDFEVEYDLGVTDFMLPPLVLQPVVENAVRHGSEGEDGKNHITIATFERDGSTVIEVTNTADEAGRVTAAARADAAIRLRETDGRVTVEMQERSAGQGSSRQSVGLDNVRTRLAMQCNGKLSMKTADGETKVIIEIAAQQ